MTAGTAPLIERETEVAQLTEALDAAADGRGRLVVLEGPAGIGKTRLVRHAAEVAEDRGMQAFLAAGAALERDLPYGCTLQLFAAPLAALDPAERERVTTGPAHVAAALLEGGAAPSGPNAALQLLHGLHWLCANLAERAPLLLALDDAHEADPQTLQFLSYLAGRLGELPVALVVARRTGTEPVDPALDALVRAPDAEHVTPRELSPAAVALRTRDVLPGATDAFCAACAELTAGNPLYLDALLRTAARDGMAPDDEGAKRIAALPLTTIARAVLAQIAGLGADAVALAGAVAVLGDGAALRIAATLARLERERAVAAADRLAAAGVMAPGEPLRFTHPIVREAVYGDLPPAARADDHLRAAELLGEPADVVATHLLRATRSGSAWAVEQLRAAAAAARGRGAPDVAVRYLRRALEEEPPRAARVGILRELGAAQALTFEPAAVEHLREAWDLAEDAGERKAVALELGRALVMQGRLGEAVEVCDAAARESDPGDEDLLRLQTDLIGAARLDLGNRAMSLERLEAIRDQASGDGPAARLVLANLAYEHAMAGRPADEGAELARRALGGGELLRTETSDSPVLYLATNSLTLCERFDEADAAFEAAIADAWERGSALAFAIASCFRADAANRRGDPRTGSRHAAASVDAAEAHGWALGLPAAVAFLVDALLELGELEDAEAALTRAPLPLTSGDIPDSVFFDPVLFSRGRLRIARGDVREGLDDVLEVGRRQQAWRCTNPSVIPWRSTAALALLTLGERDRARELAADELADAERFGAPRTLLVARRAVALTAEGDETIERLREAVAAPAAGEAPLERARCQADLGAALRRAGHRREARGILAEALDVAARAGAAPLAAHAEQELRATGARPRRAVLSGADALTASERRVAAMAAEGHSNPEIAQRLFVTRRTVETHLTSVYRKLGVRSRAELAAALGDPAPAASEVG
jgi:DNA-binding CsgD family transcriptional regulator